MKFGKQLLAASLLLLSAATWPRPSLPENVIPAENGCPPTTWKNKICSNPLTDIQCGTASDGSPLVVLCASGNDILDYFPGDDYKQDPKTGTWLDYPTYWTQVMGWIPWADGGSSAPTHYLLDPNGPLAGNLSSDHFWSDQNYAYDPITDTHWDNELDPLKVAHCIRQDSACSAQPIVCGCGRTDSQGCFPPGTLITLANGKRKKVEDLSAGEELWNPLLQKAVRIKRLIEGPEKLPLIEVGFEGGKIRVTQGHPILVADSKPIDDAQASAEHIGQIHRTPISLQTDMRTSKSFRAVKASLLGLGELIQGADGKLHPVTSLRLMAVEEGQIVINFELDTFSLDPKERAVLSDDMVTGDFILQSAISAQTKEQPTPF